MIFEGATGSALEVAGRDKVTGTFKNAEESVEEVFHFLRSIRDMGGSQWPHVVAIPPIHVVVVGKVPSDVVEDGFPDPDADFQLLVGDGTKIPLPVGVFNRFIFNEPYLALVPDHIVIVGVCNHPCALVLAFRCHADVVEPDEVAVLGDVLDLILDIEPRFTFRAFLQPFMSA